MESKTENCQYVKAYSIACQSLDDINKTLVMEEKESSKILELVGLSIQELDPKLQVNLAKASEILENWNVVDVDEATVISKFSSKVIECVNQELNAMKYKQHLKEFKVNLNSIHEIEGRLKMDIEYNQSLLQKLLKEYDIQDEEVENLLDLVLPKEDNSDTNRDNSLDHSGENKFEEILKLFDELKAMKAENSKSQKELDSYCKLPTNYAEALKVVDSARNEIVELSEVLKNLN